MHRTRFIFAVILAIALMGGIATLSYRLAPTSPTRIEEDDPRWDCHTMGNHLCGPAADEVSSAQAKAGPNFWCDAEPNTSMPEGYEVICYPND